MDTAPSHLTPTGFHRKDIFAGTVWMHSGWVLASTTEIMKFLPENDHSGIMVRVAPFLKVTLPR